MPVEKRIGGVDPNNRNNGTTTKAASEFDRGNGAGLSYIQFHSKLFTPTSAQKDSKGNEYKYFNVKGRDEKVEYSNRGGVKIYDRNGRLIGRGVNALDMFKKGGTIGKKVSRVATKTTVAKAKRGVVVKATNKKVVKPTVRKTVSRVAKRK